MDQKMQQCIQDCLDCYRTCTETIMHCLEMGGDHAAPNHIRLLMDCVEICKVAADFMIRGSNHAGEICDTCASICETCAAECEDMVGSDEQMKICAAMCRRCATSCREMVEQMGV